MPKDPRGGHVRLYWSILDCPAWRVLTHADVRVYLALRRKLGRTNNGDINATLAEMKHAGISSSSTLAAALHRLEALGFIEKTRQGGIANGGKLCSLYRFTDEPTLDIAKAGVRASPATNDWERFKNMGEARAAARPFHRKTTPKIRLSKRSEPPRYLRRLFHLRRLSHYEEVKVFTRGAGSCSTHGLRRQ
ncbi:hypothetical protein GHT07_00005, partial [Caenimonas koreensis DSM 17982]